MGLGKSKPRMKDSASLVRKWSRDEAIIMCVCVCVCTCVKQDGVSVSILSMA